MEGTITEQDKQFVETWESVSPIQNWIFKLDARGDAVAHGVQGARRFTLTSYERFLTQERVHEKDNDPFTNGCFRPIIVPETMNIETNPNALSDDDIDNLFRSSDIAWTEYLKVVDSPATLRRFIERAEKAEISLRRFRDLEEKLATVAPKTRIVQKDQDKYDALGGGPARKGR